MTDAVTGSLSRYMRQRGREDAREDAITASAEVLYEAALRDPKCWREAHAETEPGDAEIKARIAGDTAEAERLSDVRMRDWIWNDCYAKATRKYDERRNAA